MLQRLIHNRKLIFFSLLPIGWLVWVGVFSHAATPAPDLKTPVEVQVASAMTLPVYIHAMGELVAARHVDITPEVAGHVKAVFSANGGVTVRQGTWVIQLDDAATQAKLASVKAALRYSQADFSRKTELAKKGMVSRQAIDQALADLKAREAEVQTNQVNLDAMHLVAPFDGVLGRMNVTSGDYVSAGQKLVELTDTSDLRVQYTVPERWFSAIKPGQAVVIHTAALPGKAFSGKVTFVSPTVNSLDRTLTLYADIPNSERLLTAGLFVNVEQTLGATQSALVVSPVSLTPTLGGQVVFRVTKGRVERVPVTVLRRSNAWVQVRGDVAAGDLIVVAGQQKLRDGMPVEVVRTT